MNVLGINIDTAVIGEAPSFSDLWSFRYIATVLGQTSSKLRATLTHTELLYKKNRCLQELLSTAPASRFGYYVCFHCFRFKSFVDDTHPSKPCLFKDKSSTMAQDQIRQMVNFILQEAHEKANEIRVKVGYK